MKQYMETIIGNMQCMTRKQRFEYIITYYWYHILGIITMIALILFLFFHINAMGKEQIEFACVLVNQDINFQRDEALRDDFSKFASIDSEKISIDSDYNISYGNIMLNGVNESSYEKLFFKWRNKEIDAIIMPESFYQYCKGLGAVYENPKLLGANGLPLYEDNGSYTAIKVSETILKEYMVDSLQEEMLLVFLSEGKHKENCKQFVSFLNR